MVLSNHLEEKSQFWRLGCVPPAKTIDKTNKTKKEGIKKKRRNSK